MSRIDDNPIRRLQDQFGMEDLATSPVTEAIARLADRVPLPELFKNVASAFVGHLDRQADERRDLLLQTVADEAMRCANEIERLQKSLEEHSTRLSREDMADLLIDALRKTQNTRAKDRVRRIALILVNGLVEGTSDADEIEELMRTARELSDRDIVFLRELVKIERSLLETREYIPRYDAHTVWTNGFWGNRVMPEADSVFQKLESYGLVTRIPPPNNMNIMADIQNRYALLPKGLRFVDLIKSRADA